MEHPEICPCLLTYVNHGKKKVEWIWY